MPPYVSTLPKMPKTHLSIHFAVQMQHRWQSLTQQIQLRSAETSWWAMLVVHLCMCKSLLVAYGMLCMILLHDFVANSHSGNAEKPVSQQVAVPVHRERL